jgi:flagellar hook-length control protein FliK
VAGSAAIAASPPASATSLGGSSSAAPASYGVDLQQTIEAVHATIELATRQGLTQARIALQPEELGEIRIHLTQSAQGLVARVTADTPAAAQALAAGHAELRQSLSSLNLCALHLDTSAFEHSGSGAQAGEHDSPNDAATTGARHSRQPAIAEHADDLHGDDDASTDSLSATARLSRGALVDVLA